MDSESNGGLWNESVANHGDSGGGALMEKDGDLWHIGTKSYGYRADYDDGK